MGFEPGNFPAYEAKLLIVALLDEISIEHLNFDRVLHECAIKIYLDRVPRGRCRTMYKGVADLIPGRDMYFHFEFFCYVRCS